MLDQHEVVRVRHEHDIVNPLTVRRPLDGHHQIDDLLVFEVVREEDLLSHLVAEHWSKLRDNIVDILLITLFEEEPIAFACCPLFIYKPPKYIVDSW